MLHGVLSVLLSMSAVLHVQVEASRPEFPDDLKDVITYVHDLCVGNTGVAEKDIENCEHGIFPDDRKLKCYMFCLLEEASFVEEDGSIDYDMLIGMIPDEWRDKVSSMISACKHLDVLENDKCDRAFDVHKCMYKQDPDLYFLF